MLTNMLNTLFKNMLLIEATLALTRLNIEDDIAAEEELHHGNIQSTHVDIFSYIASVLNVNELISTGAFINDKWVVTSASEIYLHKKAIIDLNVRLDSMEYARGGILIAVMHVKLHPFYEVGTPGYDVALLCMTHPLIRSSNSKPLILPTNSFTNLPNSHILVSAWGKKIVYPTSTNYLKNDNGNNVNKTIIQFIHLHRSDTDVCNKYLVNNSITHTNYNNIRCLYAIDNEESCMKLAGAPIVSQGVLYGVVSSNIPPSCDPEKTPYLITMVTSSDILVWANTIMATNLQSKTANNYYNDGTFVDE